jgi:SAM-dependent methyltransferase
MDLCWLGQFPDSKGTAADLFLCDACGAVTPIRPPTSTVSNTRLQTDLHEGLWALTDTSEMANLAAEMARTVEFYASLLGAPWPDRPVVDVGAGRGNLMAAIAAKGFSVLGCEPGERLVELARRTYGFDDQILACAEGLPFLLQLEQSRVQPSVVFMWHVIEHVEAPLALLRQACELVGRDGAVILQAPMAESRYIYPEHIFFVTRAWGYRMAERLGMRLLINDVSCVEQFVSVAFCHPDAPLSLPGFEPPPPPATALGGWISDLTGCLMRLGGTYWDQKHLIDLRDEWIVDLRHRLADAEAELARARAQTLGSGAEPRGV